MNFTGERVIPGQDDVDLFNEHRARYRFAQRFCSGKKVLDAACGSGYGSALLAEGARRVVGVDLAAEAVQYARLHYEVPNVHFAQADCLVLPFAARQFDVIVAFEIIEHLPDAAAFLRELHRALHPSGLLILSTPNRLYYTEDRGEVNPFHHREFSFTEFRELLEKHFAHHAIWLENHVAGLLIADSADQLPAGRLASSCLIEEAQHSDSLEDRARTAHYMVALCSAQALPTLEPLLYLPSTGNVLREREQHIASLQRQVEQARQERDLALAQLRKLEALLQERTEWARSLEKESQERTEWAQSLEQQLSEKGRRLLDLQADYEEKIRWAQSLDQEIAQARSALQKLRQEFEERTAWALALKQELQDRYDDLRLVFGSRWYRLGKNLRLSPVPPSDQPAGGSAGKGEGP